MPQQESSTAIPRDATVAALVFPDLELEFASTRRLLERYPEEHGDWRPHEKSMSLRELAGHVAQLPLLARFMAEDPEWNAEDKPYVPPSATTRDEMVALFDQVAADAKQAIERLDFAALADPWRMRNGEVVYFSGERGMLLRRFLVSHTAHHRGQLTVYYRLLGAPVPGMYGPTADGSM